MTLAVFAASVASVGNADNAPMWESPEGLAPGVLNTSVRMANEQVEIKVIEQNGSPKAMVNATFNMANEGPSVQILTGFPSFAYSATLTDDYIPVTFTLSRITGFRAWTDQTTYAPELQRVAAGKFGGSQWFVWNVAYPQGKSVQVQVAYQQELDSGIYGWAPLSYVLRTGALWNGPIGQATISMSTSDGGALVGPDPIPQQTDDTLRWTFNNFKPTQDINATYIGPANWAKLTTAQNAAAAPGASASDLILSGQSVLGVMQGSQRAEGWVGTLYGQPQFLVDRYFSLVRTWAQSATQMDPSNSDTWEFLGDVDLIAISGKGVGGYRCWPSAALNAYQEAADLGSASAADKLNELNMGLSRFGTTPANVEECGSRVLLR